MKKQVSEMPLGAFLTDKGINFSVWSPDATHMSVCIFEGAEEVQNLPMSQDKKGVWSVFLDNGKTGVRYGFRADGPYNPDNGMWFDPNKLLLDPYATKIDGAFQYDASLAAPRDEKIDTASFMPKAVVEAEYESVVRTKPNFQSGGLIYELQVRGFSMLHPDIPKSMRGTISALGHPVVIQHLKNIGVNAIEMMPITAWIDERHLSPLGLHNCWGYNPVSYFALDPRLAPGGLPELRAAVEALHDEGISVIQDVVFNHNGESDKHGPILSFRGLDSKSYFRTHEGDAGQLINDTGCGNSIDCSHPRVRSLILDSMRHFVLKAGIDGFRFDLGPALGREDKNGGVFNPQALLLNEMLSDEVLKDCILIAEPWDIGPDGYQLGKFPTRFLEWNDIYRDDVRRFWKGDASALSHFVTRLCGSADIFSDKDEPTLGTRTVNFIAAHDGFSLADIVAYENKHNFANGESNRDGHNHNISWNSGIEGETENAEILAKRRGDLKALLSTLFLSRGTIMLTAGDEFGRTQQGNNNAYAQDNEITWLNWRRRDKKTERHVKSLALIRAKLGLNSEISFLSDEEVVWKRFDGELMTVEDWEQPNLDTFVMELPLIKAMILFNRSNQHKTYIRRGETQTISPRTVNVIFLSSAR